MKKLFFLPSMALILGLGLTLSMSSFKSVNSLTQPADGWYQVSSTGVIDPFSIGPVAEPPLSSPVACAQDNLSTICSVKLIFDNTATALPPTYNDIPNTTGVDNDGEARLPVQ